MKNKLINTLLICLSVFFLLILWQVCGSIIDSPLILPKPLIVAKSIYTQIQSLDFWIGFSGTIIRIFSAFIISSICGLLIGFCCGKNKYIKTFFKVPLAFIRVCPVISLILMVIYCFTSNTIPVFVSVLMTLPVMITAIEKSFQKKDEKLYDMAKIYNFGKLKTIFYLDFFTVKNAFWSSLITVAGMSWKVVVAGEVLCLPKNAVGSILQRESVHMNTEEVFACTIILVFFSFIMEHLLSFTVNSFVLNKNGKKEKQCQF